jgi:hypothetical protein
MLDRMNPAGEANLRAADPTALVVTSAVAPEAYAIPGRPRWLPPVAARCTPALDLRALGQRSLRNDPATRLATTHAVPPARRIH